MKTFVYNTLSQHNTNVDTDRDINSHIQYYSSLVVISTIQVVAFATVTSFVIISFLNHQIQV